MDSTETKDSAIFGISRYGNQPTLFLIKLVWIGFLSLKTNKTELHQSCISS